MQNSPINPLNVIAKYQQIAVHYDQHAVLQKQIADELLSRLDLINIPVERILDLGCGTGNAIKPLCKAFPKAKLCVVDVSKSMLKLAKKNKPWFRKCDFIQCQAEALKLQDNTFDCVISNLLLQNCNDPDLIFSEVQRVTRENGLFSFSTLGPDSFKELRAALLLADIAKHELTFGHLTDMHDLGDALLRSGLREPVMDVDVYTLSFSRFEDLFEELNATGNILQEFAAEEIMLVDKFYPRKDEHGNYLLTVEIVYGQAWAGDGKSRVRTPDEVHFPLDKLLTRSKSE